MAEKKTVPDLAEILHQIKKVNPKATQGSLAEIAGVSEVTITKWKSKDFPVLKLLLEYSRITGESIESAIKEID